MFCIGLVFGKCFRHNVRRQFVNIAGPKYVNSNTVLYPYYRALGKDRLFGILGHGMYSCEPGQALFLNNNNQVRNLSSQTLVNEETQLKVLNLLSDSYPVLYIQESLVYLHAVTCMPWWLTVVVSTVFLRTVITFPLAAYQHYILARYENVLKEMPDIARELKQETDLAVRKFNWTERQAQYVYRRSVKKQLNTLIVRDNCHPLKATLLLWFQIPMWICLSAALRNLVYMLPHHTVEAERTYIELTSEGALWFTNLVLPDSTLVLPVFFGMVNLAIIELAALSRVKPAGKWQKVLTNFFRLLTIGMAVVASQVPSCLAVYWLTSSVYGLMQNLILMSPKVRKFFRIPLTSSSLNRPYKHVYLKMLQKVEK